jgi:LuxR family glucitol operon transcriptional activator
VKKRVPFIPVLIIILFIIVLAIAFFTYPNFAETPGGLGLMLASIATVLFVAITGIKDFLEILDRERGIIAAGTGGIRKTTLHNLPQPDYEDFVGREEEIQRVMKQLHPDSRPWIVTIDGIGGIGKSALALEIAHRYLNPKRITSEERFDAIVWVSAKETVLTAEGIQSRPQVLRNLSDIYAAIAVTLQQEKITRARSEQEQDGFIKDALTHNRTLLILDNLETVDDEKVNTFIRELPKPTKAIVTTRKRIDVSYPIRLTGLPWPDIQKMIEQECARKNVTLGEADARELFQRISGVPLAVVWSIALMGIGYRIETVLEKLGDADEKFAEFCFKQSLEAIRNEPAYKILLTLALFAADASREALGVIPELSAKERDEGLVRLEVLSLVDKQADRFKFLPLTKTYALAELKRNSELDSRLKRRWIDYLKTLCSGVDSEYYWRYRSYAFFKEGDTILDAIQWCREHGPVEDAIFLTFAAYDYLEVVGRWSEITMMVDDVLSLAESIQDDSSIARLNSIKAWILMQQGELDDAELKFIISLEKYRAQKSREGETIILQHLSAVYRKRKKFDIAAQYCERALEIASQSPAGDLLALVNTSRGKLARDQQNWTEARKIFTEIAEYFEGRVEQSPRDEPLARGNWGHLAVVEYGQGHYQVSKDLCLKSLEFFESLGTKGYMATLKLRLALAEEALGDKRNARIHALEAADWFDRLGMKPDHAEANKLLHRLKVKFGERQRLH